MDALQKKYYKIREVSEMLDVPIPTLRYWERRFPSLSPKRNQGLTRFYTADDVETVRMVRYLLKEKGLKIEAACEQIKAGSSAVMRKNRAVLRLKEARDQLQSLLDALNSRR